MVFHRNYGMIYLNVKLKLYIKKYKKLNLLYYPLTISMKKIKIMVLFGLVSFAVFSKVEGFHIR